MKDIAREAGVAQGLLHYYFDGKERLVAALVTTLLDEHLDRFRTVLATAAPRDRRAIGLDMLREKILGPRATWRLLFEVLAGGAHDGPHRQLAARFAERRALVAEHIGGKDSAARALLLDSLMLGLAAERLAGASDREVEDAFNAFVELVS
jgi:AcrR family transcriptional regulator